MSKSRERWVIKAGSSLVAGNDDGINKLFIKNLVLQVSQLLEEGIQVIIVSSGAVAKGMHELNLNERPDSLNLLQAAAAIGQLGLIDSYKSEFSNFEIKTAQVLISQDDIANRERYLNARNSLMTLLELGVVPIINENDSVSIEEISFGDNDTLAGAKTWVADGNDTLAGAIVGLTDADKFIMLTDEQGVFSQDPKKYKNAKLLTKINLDDQSLEINKIVEGTAGILGRGGMKTKIKAARLSLDAGAKTWVADGNDGNILTDIFYGQEVGTFFEGERDKLQSRKTWIASLGSPKGQLLIDDGAAKAISDGGSSLLPVGITAIEGDFEKGALVACVNQDEEIARGFSNFNSFEINLILGLKSGEINTKLGYASAKEVIHRDNLILS